MSSTQRLDRAVDRRASVRAVWPQVGVDTTVSGGTSSGVSLSCGTTIDNVGIGSMTTDALDPPLREMTNRDSTTVQEYMVARKKLCEALSTTLPSQKWIEDQKTYFDSLSAPEREAVFRYIRDQSSINALLREAGSDPNRAAKTSIDNFSRACRIMQIIRKAPPLDKNIVVFRGQREYPNTPFPSDPTKAPQTSGRLDGILSTSLLSDVALGFAKGGEEGGVLLRISLPKNIRCLMVAGASFEKMKEYKQLDADETETTQSMAHVEYEILLPHGIQYTIKSSAKEVPFAHRLNVHRDEFVEFTTYDLDVRINEKDPTYAQWIEVCDKTSKKQFQPSLLVVPVKKKEETERAEQVLFRLGLLE